MAKLSACALYWDIVKKRTVVSCTPVLCLMPVANLAVRSTPLPNTRLPCIGGPPVTVSLPPPAGCLPRVKLPWGQLSHILCQTLPPMCLPPSTALSAEPYVPKHLLLLDLLGYCGHSFAWSCSPGTCGLSHWTSLTMSLSVLCRLAVSGAVGLAFAILGPDSCLEAPCLFALLRAPPGFATRL